MLHSFMFGFIGTAIDQGEAPEYYFQKYPEDGFFSWRWILFFGFDHMFTSPVFLGMLILLGASLMACTYTTQIPIVKIARRSDSLCNFIVSSSAADELGKLLLNWNKWVSADGNSFTRLRPSANSLILTLCPKHRFVTWVLF